MQLTQCRSRVWQISKESYLINGGLPKLICIQVSMEGTFTLWNSLPSFVNADLDVL